MNAKEHRVAGICAGIITCMIMDTCKINNSIDSIDTVYKLGSYAAIIGMASIGSLVPDIDQPNSTMGKRLGPISKLLNKMFGHRGLIHFPLFLALIAGLLYMGYLYIDTKWQIIYMMLSLGFIVGYISHIFLDMFNSEGIKLFGPIIGFQFKIPTGITFKNKKKIIAWKYLKGDKIVDRCIANFISIGLTILIGLYLYGYLHIN